MYLVAPCHRGERSPLRGRQTLSVSPFHARANGASKALVPSTYAASYVSAYQVPCIGSFNPHNSHGK